MYRGQLNQYSVIYSLVPTCEIYVRRVKYLHHSTFVMLVLCIRDEKHQHYLICKYVYKIRPEDEQIFRDKRIMFKWEL